MSRAIVCTLLLASCAAGFSAAPPPPGGEYVFAPDTARLVGIERGDLVLVGKLDTDGNFLESARQKKGEESSGARFDLLNRPAADGKPRPAYEYRSGRL